MGNDRSANLKPYLLRVKMTKARNMLLAIVNVVFAKYNHKPLESYFAHVLHMHRPTTEIKIVYFHIYYNDCEVS